MTDKVTGMRESVNESTLSEFFTVGEGEQQDASLTVVLFEP